MLSRRRNVPHRQILRRHIVRRNKRRKYRGEDKQAGDDESDVSETRHLLRQANARIKFSVDKIR